jgi:cytochrome P450
MVQLFGFGGSVGGFAMPIGATFAMQEPALVLATIVYHFGLELAPRHAVWPVLRVTLRPVGGLPMIAKPRRRKDARYVRFLQ